MNQTDALNPYNIKIPSFEGPLDLLLHLIKQNKVDIYDIPIALITRQYLEYVELMKEFNLEIASEFLVMAATLIYIKSRMLLPPDETIDTEEQEDPRAGLVQRLLEYQALKEASEELKKKEEIWADVFPRIHREKEDYPLEPEMCLFDLNIFDLIDALKRIISRVPKDAIKITKETLTVKDKIAAILEKMEKEAVAKFDDLFAGDATRIQIIVTFLALLEILKIGLARAFQDKEFGTIWIRRQPESA